MSARSRASEDQLDLSLTGSTFSNLSPTRRQTKNRPSSAGAARSATRAGSSVSAPITNGYAESGSSGHDGTKPKHARSGSHSTVIIGNAKKAAPQQRANLSDDFLALFENAQPKMKRPSARQMKTSNQSPKKTGGFLPLSARSTSTVGDSDIDSDNVMTGRTSNSSAYLDSQRDRPSASNSNTHLNYTRNRSVDDVHGSPNSPQRGKHSSGNSRTHLMDSQKDRPSASNTNTHNFMRNSSADEAHSLLDSRQDRHSNSNLMKKGSPRETLGSPDGDHRINYDHNGLSGTSKYAMGKNAMLSSQHFDNYLQQSKVSLENIDRTLEQPRPPVVENNSTRPRTMSASKDLSQQESFERNTLHDTEETVAQRKRKPQNLNLNTTNIANNMTAQALTPTAKTAFSDIENSYQNIKHKTPVNQVKGSPPASLKNKKISSTSNDVKPVVGRNIAEDYIKRVNMAATRVQRWFRRSLKRKKSGAAAVKRLLDQKKIERDQQQREEEKSLQRSNDRKKLREEKARQARRQAIQDLQKKKEDRRLDVQRKAEEEIEILKASGKVGPKQSRKKAWSKTRSTARSKRSSGSDSEGEAVLQRPSTGSSVGRTVDNIFKNNTRTPRSDNVEDSGTEISEEPSAMYNGGTPPESEAPTSRTVDTKTTLDDLMETLKVLEQDDSFVANNVKKDDSGSDGDGYLSADKIRRLSSKNELNSSGTLTEDKLRGIMSFLDEVDTADRLTEIDQDLSRANEILERPALLVPSADELMQMEQHAVATAEVTNTVLAQKLELEEKKRTVQMLQKALNQQRELTVRHAKETEKEMKKRLNVQKDEYEEAIKRHLGFIDQLIDDKKSIGEKCENLVREIKTVDKKYSDKLKALEDKHTQELTKVKEIQAAAEKLRRERWIDEKTKKIKEMTVKGLEPEIQRLIAKHKTELKKIKQIHEAELLESDERAGGRYVRMTEELRDQLSKEKEAACQREREIARQRYEKQLQQEEESYQQQRRRMYSEIAEEKERISEAARRQRQEMDKLQRQLEDGHSSSVDAMKHEYEEARDEQERRHQNEIKELQERLKIEKEAWEENYMKKQETWLLSKERELKENVRRDRDKEIELVIARLEEDSATQREECERAAENRIKRIRDKYEGEMNELERSERHALEKYNEIKARMTEVEGENERFKVVIKQKDISIEDAKQLLEKLHKERDHVSDIIRQEFADKLVATDEENKRVKHEMAELKSRHRFELEKMKQEMEVIHSQKAEEMEAVHKRVKQAIVKKEDVVKQLRSQYEAACKRADHLEGLLEQQRKQLLGKK